MPGLRVVDVCVHVANILVVEDEPLTCMAVADLLQTAGFDTVSAPNDAAAYSALQDDAIEFDALVIDVNLGEGTTGFDVARFARRLRPDVPVIYLSGGSPDWVTAFGVTDSEFLGKPFKDAELLKLLKRMIGKPGGGAANPMPTAT